MAAKKPARAGSRKAEESTGAASTEAGAGGAGEAVGGTGARAKGAGRAAAAGAGSGGTPDTGAKAGAKSAGRGKAASSGDAPAAAGGKGTRKAAAGSKSGDKPSGTRGGARSGGKAAAGSSSGGSDLQKRLRDFVTQNPNGWGHDQWQGLLGQLRESGVDVSDEGRIGMELEQQRLLHALEQKQISGLGQAEVRGLADRFGTLWSLRHASIDEIQSVSGMDRQKAEKVQEAIR